MGAHTPTPREAVANYYRLLGEVRAYLVAANEPDNHLAAFNRLAGLYRDLTAVEEPDVRPEPFEAERVLLWEERRGRITLVLAWLLSVVAVIFVCWALSAWMAGAR